MIKKDQYVKILFNNGIWADGYVESWSDQKSVLRSTSNNSFFIIQKTLQDVMVVRLDSEQHKTKPTVPVCAKEEKKELELQFEETYELPSQDELRLQKMCQLKIALAEADKKIITDKIKSHTPNNVRKVNYGYGFLKE